MNIQFMTVLEKTLDKDLCDLVYNNYMRVSDVAALQQVRLLRGRPVLVSEGTSVEGWSPDGISWYPYEPGKGTFTTGG